MMRRRLATLCCTLAVFLMAAAAPAARADGWSAGNVVQLVDPATDIWNSSNDGSGKSETLTSGSCRIDGSSSTHGGMLSPTSYNLHRTYKRTYTKNGNPINFNLTITAETNATADTASVSPGAQASASATAASNYGGGISKTSSASQMASGTNDPPATSDPKSGTSPGHDLDVTTDVAGTLSAGGGATSYAPGGNSGQSSSYAKLTFKEP